MLSPLSKADNNDWAYDMADQLSIKVEGNPVQRPPNGCRRRPSPPGLVRVVLSRRLQTQPESKMPIPPHQNGIEHYNVDISITLFKCLIREPGRGPDAEGTIKLFQDILPVGLHRTIY